MSSLQELINGFTIIGSIIGITAFVLNIIQPIKDYNINKWNEFKAALSLNDLIELRDDLGKGIVLADQYNNLIKISRFIKNGDDLIKFKSFIKHRYKKHLENIHNSCEKLRDNIQCPLWDISKTGFTTLNKNFIYYESGKSDKEGDLLHRQAIDIVYEEVEIIISEYRKIQTLATRMPIEYLIK